MNELKDEDIRLAIIALAYTRELPLMEAAHILAHEELWPKYAIRSVEALAMIWDDETGFYRYHNLEKALRAFKAEREKNRKGVKNGYDFFGKS